MTRKRDARLVNRLHYGFTLIELLTVIAIITLLIGLLVPALSRAREQAKIASTRAILKSAGDGLEMFKNENPRECRGGDGYPSSSMRDDPTEEGEQRIFGAQWLVRFLMGKKLDGYIPRRHVPRDMLLNPTEFWEQQDWYEYQPTTANPHAPLDRVGPYLEPDSVTIEAPKNLEGAENVGGPLVDDVTKEQLVLLDNFDYPVLYYSANTRLARKAGARVAGYSDDCPGGVCDPPGIYFHSDNALFTGLCDGGGGTPGTCLYGAWDFAGIGPDDHKLKDFGNWTPGKTPSDPAEFSENVYTFPYYVLNKNVFESTYDPATDEASLVPHRRDTFILITPGPDGVYGTKDDVTNF